MNSVFHLESISGICQRCSVKVLGLSASEKTPCIQTASPHAGLFFGCRKLPASLHRDLEAMTAPAYIRGRK